MLELPALILTGILLSLQSGLAADPVPKPKRVSDYKQYLQMELQRLQALGRQKGLSPEAKAYVANRIKAVKARMKKALDGVPGQMVEFMNTRAFGTTFVYVIDKSRSMAGKRLRAAKRELMRSISGLNPEMAFYVIFYDTQAIGLPSGEFIRATEENKAACEMWLQKVRAKGRTDPSDALLKAFKLRPDAIFLLSDGLFKENVLSKISVWRNIGRDSSSSKGSPDKAGSRARVNTIAFMSEDGREVLERIAYENSGQFVYIPPPPSKWKRSLFSWIWFLSPTESDRGGE